MNELFFGMAVAFVGWLASSYAVRRSPLAPRWQRRLIMPLWLLWMVVALGGPVVNGSLASTEAFTAGAACMVGMSFSMLLNTLRSWKRR